MSEQNPGPTTPNALNSASAAECTRLARDFRARAERYRRLAESLFDANIIAVVLACARELEQHAEAVNQCRLEAPE